MVTDPVTIAARTEILRRIRDAKGSTATANSAQTGWSAIDRKYRRQPTRSREAIVELLVDRLQDYDARVLEALHVDVRIATARMLKDRHVKRMIIPPGLPAAWLPGGVEFILDEGLPAIAFDRIDGVMTAATLAIAETGTVVLQNVPGQGRRAATLVPDYHLCIVRAADVFETVPEAMDHLHPTAALATTFVSGPSATADIEMTRIKGVHGPRSLDVILVR